MLGMRDFSFVLILATIYVTAISLKSIHWKDIDTIVLIFILYSLLSFLFSDYDFSLYYYGIKLQIIPILFYYIARGKYFKDNSFFDNIKLPLILVYISAILLYFFPPSWYLEFKLANIGENVSEYILHEYTRMSSFWSHPYFVGYSSAIFIVYMLDKIIRSDIIRVNDLCYIILAVFCLFFSQMRVCIAFVFLYYLYITIYSFRHKLKIRKLFFKGWWLLLILTILISFIIVNYLDSSFIEYIKDRSINSEENFVLKRFEQFAEFIKRISFLGEGLGKYGHSAIAMNKPCIADCEYIRIPVELGIIGSLLFFIIIIHSLIRGLSKIKLYRLEVFIILFFLLTMIGAAPLEMTVQQPFILWFCIGHLMNKIDVSRIS